MIDNHGLRRHEPPPFKPLLIDVGQLCALLNCGRTTAFELIRTKRVRSMLIGRSRRVLLADAERLVTEGLREGAN